MSDRVELPKEPELRACKTTREMIIQKSAYDSAIYGLFIQEMNNNRLRDKNQDLAIEKNVISIEKNTKFTDTVKGALKVLALIVTVGIPFLFQKVRAFLGFS